MIKKIVALLMVFSMLCPAALAKTEKRYESREALLVSLGLLKEDKDGYITNAELESAVSRMSGTSGFGYGKPEEAALTDVVLAELTGVLGYPKEQKYYSEVSKGAALSEKYISKDIFVKLLYNTLTAERIKITHFEGDKPVYEKEGTILKDIFDVEKVTAVVEADSTAYVGEAPETALAGNEILIGKITAKCDLNTKEYLGRNAEAYIRLAENDDTKGELLAIEKIKIEEIKKTSEVIDGATTSKKLVWLDKEREELKSKEIPKNAVVIYNGKRLGTAWGQEWSLFTPGDGEVNLIDNNSDGNVDVVMIWNYNLYVVDYVSTEREMIFCRDFSYGTAIELEDKNYYIFDGDGNKLSLAEISPYNVLCVTDTNENDIYIACSKKEPAEGFYRRSGFSIYVGNDKYSIGNSGLYNFNTFSDGDMVRVYFDIYDRTAYIVRVSENEYAFLNKAYYDEGEDEPMYLKLYTSDGNILKKELADKVKVINEDGETVYQKNKSGNNSFSVLFGLISGRHELIKYKENKLGKINRITFARSKIGRDIPDTTGGFDLYYADMSSGSADFKEAKYLQNCFVSRYRVTKNTLLFSVEENKNEPEKFKKLSMSDLNGDSDYYVMIYDVNNRFEAGAVVFKKYTDWYAKSGSIVSDVSKEAGADGETLTKIKLITKGEESVIYADDTDIKANADIAWRFGNGELKLSDISVGDIIYYTLGKNGYVSGIAYLHKNIPEQGFYHKSNYGWGDIYIPNCAMAVIYCPIKSLYDDMMVIYSDGSMPVTVNPNRNYYLCEKNKVRKINYSELAPGDKMVGMWKWSSLNDMVVYR